ncbi:MAG TPA: DUF2079 domain-containing protein [Chloroflexi bacterium]|nr:DUF2079 domain-containing protein [Chloroflexota bacterium]
MTSHPPPQPAIASPTHWRRRLRDPYLWALLALAAIYVVVFTRLAWELHAGMRTHRSDLGQIDQAVWNSSRGRWLAQTDNGFEATRLTDHVEPMLVLISPIFWLWDDVRALLLLQVLAAAVGVLPLYFLTLHQCEQLLSLRARLQVWRMEPLQHLVRPLAFALGVAYLLAPQLQSALLTEFHAAPLATPLILWAFWAVATQRWGQFVVAALLVAAVKEEMALLAAGLGAWALWRAWWEGGKARAGDWTAGRLRRLRQQPPSPIANRSISNLQSPNLPISTLHSPIPPFFAGATVLLLSLLWFSLATFVIVPAHAAPVYGAVESTYFQRYGALGDSSADILRSIVTRPDLVLTIAAEPPRVAYLVGLLVIFAWLPLLGLEVLLLSLPLLLANLLSAYPAQYYGEFHYSAPLIAYAAVAAAYGVGRLWRFLARRLERASPAFQHLPAQDAATMAAAALVQNARTALLPIVTVGLVSWVLVWTVGNYLQHGRGPWGGRYDAPAVTAHHHLLERFTAQIPAAAAVTATAGVQPHVSHRRFVYQFPLGLDAPTPPAEQATWALLDVTTNTDMAPGDLKARVMEMLADDWGVVDAADGFLLLARGQGDKTIPDAFFTFTRIAQGDAPDASLELVAVASDDWPRWRQTRLVFEWQVGGEPGAASPWVEIVTPQQEVLATLNTAAPPALVWLPPAAWQPGDRVRVTTLPLHLPRTFAVRAAGRNTQPAAIFHRLPNGVLTQLPDDLGATPDLGEALTAAGLGPLTMATGEIHFADGMTAPLRMWVETQPGWPGAIRNVWLQWGLATWPPELSAFVHLRRNGETLAQADGIPTFWSAPRPGEGAAFLNDWRQVKLPADAPTDGAWTLAVGLYDPQSGERVPLADGDELVIALPAPTAPPIADQACALIPATCGGMGEQ